MGYALFPSFDRELPGIDATTMSGKILAANIEKLDAAAKKLKVPTLTSMISASEDELDDLLGEDLDSEEGVDQFVGDIKKDLAKVGLDKEVDLAGLKESLDGINAARPLSEEWFPSGHGLKTVRALITFVSANPKRFSPAEHLLTELADLERCLTVGEKHEAGFHLTPDF